MEKLLFTSESVTEGHPDKVCDAISDSVLDALMAQDPMSRVACEAASCTGFVLVTGEITTNANIDYKAIAKSVGKSAITTLKAQECPSAKMDVIIENGFGGVIFHEACGHSLEATSVAKGLSVFCGKKGQKIASDLVTAVDDGTIENGWGSGNYDDEGVPAQKTYMVRDGILESYLHDRISASWYGVAPTGNGRRENFRYNPIPRMRATYMENGTADLQGMISEVKHGIYVDEFKLSPNPFSNIFPHQSQAQPLTHTKHLLPFSHQSYKHCLQGHHYRRNQVFRNDGTTIYFLHLRKGYN